MKSPRPSEDTSSASPASAGSSAWETAYVASDVPLARGWERQLDRETNPLFYDGTLTTRAYGRWLRADAIEYVALPDAPLDQSALAEAHIIARRPRYLVPVWRNEHWRVWRVIGARPMVSGGHLVSTRPDSLTVDVARPGTVLVRVHYTSHWTLDGAGCVLPGPHGWTVLRVAHTFEQAVGGFPRPTSARVGSQS